MEHVLSLEALLSIADELFDRRRSAIKRWAKITILMTRQRNDREKLKKPARAALLDIHLAHELFDIRESARMKHKRNTREYDSRIDKIYAGHLTYLSLA